MGVVKISWDSTQSSTDDITHTEWNSMVDYIKNSTGAAGGETNTVSETGGGVGLYHSKSGVDFIFKTLTTGSNLVSLGDGATLVTIGVNEANINHDNLTNFDANEHFTMGAITTVGTIASGTWEGTAIADAQIASSATWDAKLDSVTNTGGENEVYKEKVGNDIRLRTLKAGTNITISTNTNDLEISAAGSVGEANTVSETGSGTGLYHSKSGVDLIFKTLISGSNLVSLGDGATEVTISVNEANIDHDALTNFAANEHFTQANIVTVGTVVAGTWNGTAIADAYIDSSATWDAKLDDVVSDTTPQLGGNLDINEKFIQIQPTMSSDHTAQGIVIYLATGENVAIGDICYLKSDGKFWKAVGTDSSMTKGMLGMATGSVTANNTGNFLIYGTIRDDTWTWTTGGELYVPTSAGNPTATQPTASGHIVRVVGYATTDDELFFNPGDTYVELA